MEFNTGVIQILVYAFKQIIQEFNVNDGNVVQTPHSSIKTQHTHTYGKNQMHMHVTLQNLLQALISLFFFFAIRHLLQKVPGLNNGKKEIVHKM